MPKNKPLRSVLGANVAAVMAAKKLSQVKVAASAKKAGLKVDQTTVSRVMRAGKLNATREEAEYPTTIDTIEAIAHGLGVEPWRLFVPATFDDKLLAVLNAWSVSSEVGRDLLRSAAEVASTKYGRNSSREGERSA